MHTSLDRHSGEATPYVNPVRVGRERRDKTVLEAPDIPPAAHNCTWRATRRNTVSAPREMRIAELVRERSNGWNICARLSTR